MKLKTFLKQLFCRHTWKSEGRITTFTFVSSPALNPGDIMIGVGSSTQSYEEPIITEDSPSTDSVNFVSKWRECTKCSKSIYKGLKS